MNRFSRRVCILLLAFLPVVAVSQQKKEKVTCYAQVVDANGQPVVGAEVAAYQRLFVYSDGKTRSELLDEGKTDADGAFVLNMNAANRRHVWIVARKNGLASAWSNLSQFSLSPKVTLLLGEPFELAGTVVDETTKPIAGARLTMLPANPSEAPLRILASWLTAETDANGRFRFSSLPVDASADFLVTAPGRASIYTMSLKGALTGVQFAAGRTDIRLVLPPEARIQGRVIDTDGNGVPGIRLVARPKVYIGNYYANNAVSGKDGRFLFVGVKADTYSLQVVPRPWEMDEWVGRDVKVVARAGQTTDGVTVKVSKGGLVDVIVLDEATNQPLVDFKVRAYTIARFGDHPGFLKAIKTDSDGHAVIRMPLGKCYVSGANKPVIVTKERPSRVRWLTEDVNLTVSGVVYDGAGQPAAGVDVAVVPPGYFVAYTDAAGKFEISYRVVSKQRYVFARCLKRNLAAAVEIKGQSKPLNIRLKSALTLTGRVTDPSGRGIPVVKVQLSTRILPWNASLGAPVTTDSDGRYEIPAVPPKQKAFKYCIDVEAAAGYGLSALKEDVLTHTSRKRVEISSFVLLPSNMSISGVVVDAKGKPSAGELVFVSAPDGPGNAGQPDLSTITDAEGKFYFNRICKGPLSLQASMPSRGNTGYLDAKAGDQNVKIVLEQEGVHIRHTSLVGKALPQLRQFKLKLDANQTKNKKILVCFWDMEQRPSRNYVQRLQRRAKVLARKGVYVILIHATKVDNQRLNEWLKKHNIDLMVGWIKGDVNEVRRDWGVRSLPWLILTNAEHVVTAEGFSLNELNKKIKKADNAKR